MMIIPTDDYLMVNIAYKYPNICYYKLPITKETYLHLKYSSQYSMNQGLRLLFSGVRFRKYSSNPFGGSAYG